MYAWNVWKTPTTGFIVRFQCPFERYSEPERQLKRLTGR